MNLLLFLALFQAVPATAPAGKWVESKTTPTVYSYLVIDDEKGKRSHACGVVYPDTAVVDGSAYWATAFTLAGARSSVHIHTTDLAAGKAAIENVCQ